MQLKFCPLACSSIVILKIAPVYWAELFKASLRGQLLSVLRLYYQIRTLVFFVEKNERSFCNAKASHIFFNKKYWPISDSNIYNFNETLTNDIVSFKTTGPRLFDFKVTGYRYTQSREATLSFLFLSLHLRISS